MKSGGIVLCGGHSRRMGRPKAWLPFGGERMLPRVVRLLGEAVGAVVVVAAVGQDVPPLPDGVALVRDAEPDRGPLGGIHAGLTALAGVEAAFVSPCDAPMLAPAFVRRVLELLDGHDGAVPLVGGRPHPLAAAYRPSALPAVARLLDRRRYRVTDLFDEIAVRFVTADELTDADPTLATLRNLNTPEEYAEASRLGAGF